MKFVFCVCEAWSLMSYHRFSWVSHAKTWNKTLPKYFKNIIIFRGNLYEFFWHDFRVWDSRDSVEGMLYFLDIIFIPTINIFMVYGYMGNQMNQYGGERCLTNSLRFQNWIGANYLVSWALVLSPMLLAMNTQYPKYPFQNPRALFEWCKMCGILLK